MLPLGTARADQCDMLHLTRLQGIADFKYVWEKASCINIPSYTNITLHFDYQQKTNTPSKSLDTASNRELHCDCARHNVYFKSAKETYVKFQPFECETMKDHTPAIGEVTVIGENRRHWNVSAIPMFRITKKGKAAPSKKRIAWNKTCWPYSRSVECLAQISEVLLKSGSSLNGSTMMLGPLLDSHLYALCSPGNSSTHAIRCTSLPKY